MNNFTNDNLYRNALYYRFYSKKIISLDTIDLVKYYDGINCFQYFDLIINDNDLIKLKQINKTKIIKFRYINKESIGFKTISKNFEIEIDDEWDAPIIQIKKDCFEEYLNSKSYNFRRLIKKCSNLEKKLKIVKSNKNNINKLFKDVLKIDQDSWKYKEKSDMLSLDNEQIIYVTLLKYCNLYISYFDNKPIGYSLLIKYNDKYYAAKWGATDFGRAMNSGIICLINQIKDISSKENLFLDLWGRRNKIYDRMATHSIKRIYFSILKNGNKKS